MAMPSDHLNLMTSNWTRKQPGGWALPWLRIPNQKLKLSPPPRTSTSSFNRHKVSLRCWRISILFQHGSLNQQMECLQSFMWKHTKKELQDLRYQCLPGNCFTVSPCFTNFVHRFPLLFLHSSLMLILPTHCLSQVIGDRPIAGTEYYFGPGLVLS